MSSDKYPSNFPTTSYDFSGKFVKTPLPHKALTATRARTMPTNHSKNYSEIENSGVFI